MMAHVSFAIRANLKKPVKNTPRSHSPQNRKKKMAFLMTINTSGSTHLCIYAALFVVHLFLCHLFPKHIKIIRISGKIVKLSVFFFSVG